ncbi:flagellar protein FlaG [Sneathiella litorea]|uniref:Flagellar protein FlaG n=1 Tax=Sneathiella litorea TaxID=2606216 RepID=A0A6L8W8M1_9PROT|nr:flagellar protein FlaG [Sneathiella litorea]MZR30812.1 hypothetical protein [Sneathiella litorea]
MDVTPFGKQVAMPSTLHVSSSVDRGNSANNLEGKLPVSPGMSAAIEDPVKRAEETIGALFTDSRFPSGRFSIDQDEESGRYVYRLIDQQTDEVLKQFPGDYVLRRVAYYRELQGLAVNSEV